jgi:hypothetical protein
MLMNIVKKVIVAGVVIVIAGYSFNNMYSLSFTNGSPAGCSGSPNDVTCSTNCHNTTKVENKTDTGWIKSNIPTAGYVGGTTYTITTTATGIETSKKFGFEISPQYADGKLAGELIVTNTTETKLVGSKKYIVQLAAGAEGIGSKTWSFNWVAPPKGSGKLTFFGAYLIGGTPEISVTSFLEVNESL